MKTEFEKICDHEYVCDYVDPNRTPLELLKNHCKFEDPHHLYVLLAVARKKFNKDITSKNEVVFREIIRKERDIERKYKKLKNAITDYTDDNGKPLIFYMYISINPRDARKAYHEFKTQLLEFEKQAMMGNDISTPLKRLDNVWLSSTMKKGTKANKGLFLIDIDTLESDKVIKIVQEFVEVTIIKLFTPTRNGYHLLTEPFDARKLQEPLGDYMDYFEFKYDSLLFVEYFGILTSL